MSDEVDMKIKDRSMAGVMTRMDLIFNPDKELTAAEPGEAGYITLESYLAKCNNIQPNIIKYKLLKEGIKEHKCEICGLTTWNEEPIPLELHYKDGNRLHNYLDNYQLLCPNCHALTASHKN